MKLYEKLPDSIEIDGRKVRLHLDFRNVLRMIDILMQEDLTDEAREWLAMKCICRHPRKGMLPKVKTFLFPHAGKEARERVMDYAQDADLIRAAFQQAYGIDLYREKLHWFRFMCLLSFLPSGSRYSDVLNIRTRPMPEPTKYNLEERKWLMQAKAEVAVKVSEREQEERYQKDVANIASVLMGMAGGSETNV